MRAPENVRTVVLVPENEPLDFEQKDGRVEFVVPKLEGHQMVALELAGRES